MRCPSRQWLTLAVAIAAVVGAAGPAGAAPVTGHSTDLSIFDRIPVAFEAEVDAGAAEIALGPEGGPPADTEPFALGSTVTVPWRLTYAPGASGGVATFAMNPGAPGETLVTFATPRAFDSLFIVAEAAEPGTKIVVDDLRIGDLNLATPGLSLFDPALADASGAPLDIHKLSGVDFLAGFVYRGRVKATFPTAPAPDALRFRILAGATSGILEFAVWGEDGVTLGNAALLTEDAGSANGRIGSSADVVGGNAFQADAGLAAGGAVVFGNDLVSAEILANDDVVLGNNGIIAGDIRAGGDVIFGNNTTIGGTVTENAGTPFTAPPLPPSGAFSAGGSAVVVAGTKSLAPGSYGVLRFDDFGVLNLIGGSYAFTGVVGALSNRIQVSLVSVEESTLVLVDGDASFGDGFELAVSGGSGSQVLLETHGMLTVGDDAVIDGSLFSLHSIVIANQAQLTGSVYGDGAVSFGNATQILFEASGVLANRLLAADADADGVPDAVDNCPFRGNADQTDTDSDGRGDVCDNCPAVANPGQANDDGDPRGDVCDNCPFIYNPKQIDIDPNGGPDGVGKQCDNCPDVFNPGQEDFLLSTPEGAACEISAVSLFGTPPIASAPAGPAGTLLAAATRGWAERALSGVGTWLGASRAEAQAGTAMLDLFLDCGANDVLTANIGISVPDGVTAVDFAGCSAPGSGPDPTERGCAGAAVGAEVDPAASFTLGTVISDPDPGDADPVPADLFVVSVSGLAANGGLLCQANDAPILLGQLNLDGLGDSVPSISNEGFAALGLDVLVSPTGGVPASNVLTEVATCGASCAITVQVSPALDDVTAFRRSQITMETALPVAHMAFGLRGFSGVQALEMQFGSCRIDVGSADPLDGDGKRICNVAAGDPELADNGPGVDPDDPTTLTLGPNPPAPTLTLSNDTLYVVLDGQIFQGLTLQPSVNNPGQNMYLGVVTYQVADGNERADPVLTFEGATEVLQTVLGDPSLTGPIVQSDGTPITAADVKLVSTGDPDEDDDTDGIGNENDNCPNFANSDQENTGGILTTSPDGIGNACQCGDFSGEGVVGTITVEDDDVEGCQQALAGTPVDPLAAERCSVSGGPSLELVDVVILDAQLGGEPLPPDTMIEQDCTPALEAP